MNCSNDSFLAHLCRSGFSRPVDGVTDVQTFCIDIVEFLKNDVMYLALGEHPDFMCLLNFVEKLVKFTCGPTAAFKLLKKLQKKLPSLQPSSLEKLEAYKFADRIVFEF
jgi:hypothetical protein